MSGIGDLYRKLLGSIIEKPTHFSWLVPSKLAASGMPQTVKALKWLRRRGVRTIFSLTETPIPKDWIIENKINYIHMPIKNHSVPSVQDIARAVDALETSISDGKPVLVHCAAGLGRTGVVLASFLVKSAGLDPVKAINKIRAMRPGSIEHVQEAAVISYSEFLNSSRKT